VQIDTSELIGHNLTVTGQSVSDVGVTMTGTTLTTDNGLISVAGVSQGQGGSAQPIGVSLTDVQINLAQGRAQVAGRASGSTAIGTLLDGVTFTTSGGQASPTQFITLAGKSGGSTNPGLQVGSNGLAVHDIESPSIAATTDVVIGGSADSGAALAIDLGSTDVNTTGRVGFQPLGVDDSGQITRLAGTAIRVGMDAGGLSTNFIVQPQWFTGSNFTAGGGVVIGASGQTGLISVADEALAGANIVTLQNQGSGSQGIELGAQTGGVQTLNLLTAGPVTQTGAITVGTLSVLAAQPASVQLTNAANQIGQLSFNGSSTGAVAAQALPTNSARAGILAFNSETGQFETVAVVASNVVIPKPFEGPDALSDLRTDVYVRGQFGRPLVCTAASSTVGGSSLADVDPIAQEWRQVRRSAQLTNCSGVRLDNSCAAF
jgi:hypothetical protein